MHDDTITFQFATQFLSRIALRLEYLFNMINQACYESHEIIHRFALKHIIELIDMIEKPELKSRFIKELIRIEHVLKKDPDNNQAPILDNLATQIHRLNQVPGSFGTSIYDDEFLKTLRQIHHPHTKECEFNSPQLVLWFASDVLLRQQTISRWLGCLNDLEDTVSIYLALLRNTAEYRLVHAQHGFYQQAMSPKATNHLVLLKMNKHMGITPKLQVGHNNLTIKLYELSTAREVHESTTEMEIAFCHI